MSCKCLISARPRASTHNTYRTHRGVHRLSELASWHPSYEQVQEIAEWIYEDWGTSQAARVAKKWKDDWAAHDILFIRDALFFCEFEKAVSWADPGRVMRVLRYWCLSFRGTGQHNYARECAEILVHLKYEVNRDLRELLERSWFINRWGKEGRWIATDLYLEHLNLLVKVRV